MAQAFLIIISALGAIYALFSKQGKVALGFLVMAISFVFAIANLVAGIWVDVFGAISMILFALGVLVIVYRKKSVAEPTQSDSSKEDN